MIAFTLVQGTGVPREGRDGAAVVVIIVVVVVATAVPIHVTRVLQRLLGAGQAATGATGEWGGGCNPRGKGDNVIVGVVRPATQKEGRDPTINIRWKVEEVKRPWGMGGFVQIKQPRAQENRHRSRPGLCHPKE
jgi:hypothetical protein